jgi:uncharacterized protein
MQAELVRIRFSKIMQTRAYTVIVVGTEQKLFAVYTEPRVGRMLQLYLGGGKSARPLTHDLISDLFLGYDLRVLQVVLNDIQDTIYFARLFLEQNANNLRHIVELDVRPSDALTLALLLDVPVYCTRQVLDQAVPLQE